MNDVARVRAAIEGEPWLVTEQALETIRTVAARANDAEAISRYAGANAAVATASVVGTTGLVNVTGPMTRYATMLTDVSGLASTETVAARFAEFDANPKITRIVLQLDTPGGMANGISELGDLVATATTPTVAYVSGACCSAGYWIASQCDRIDVNATAITGCIGVRFRAPAEPGDDDMVSRYAPAKLGSRAATQTMIDRLEDEFLAAVARGRGVTVKHVAEHFGGGGVFVGIDAVTAGLADGVATLDTVLAMDPQAREVRATPETLTENAMHRQPPIDPAPTDPDDTDEREETDEAETSAAVLAGARSAVADLNGQSGVQTDPDEDCDEADDDGAAIARGASAAIEDVR